MKRGAAIIPIAQTTGRVLIGLRSGKVSRPNTWALLAGGRESGESYAQTVVRELEEETGYDGPIDVRRLPGATKNVLLGIVPDEFPPILNWENTDAAWVTPSESINLLGEA